MASDVEVAVVTATADYDLAAGETPVSAVSWAAILAGAVVAAAASVILLALGTGLGFASVSPWRGMGASAAAFGVMTGVWLIVTQWLASGVGGYLTGRLRTRWRGTHTHEVFFRDTAHGFLTWATATVIGVVLLGIAGALAAGARGPSAGAEHAGGPYAYDVDSLYRGAPATDAAMTADLRAETVVVLQHGTLASPFPTEDRAWLAQMVAQRTALSPADAQQRVDAVIAREKLAANTARKAIASFAIFTALAMLIGALIACVSAALGGQQRDEHP